MASTTEYLNHVLELLSEVPDITYREHNGDYLLFVGGTQFGGVYHDRFLVKVVPGAMSWLSDYDVAYTNTQPMLKMDREDPEEVAEIVAAMMPDLGRFKGR